MVIHVSNDVRVRCCDIGGVLYNENYVNILNHCIVHTIIENNVNINTQLSFFDFFLRRSITVGRDQIYNKYQWLY